MPCSLALTHYFFLPFALPQVHKARLLDGTSVVVKVQYPECEANFRMDFATIIAIFRLVNEVGFVRTLRSLCSQ